MSQTSEFGDNPQRILGIYAGHIEFNKYLDFKKLFDAIEMDGSYQTSYCK
jgi:hypothetical protein